MSIYPNKMYGKNGYRNTLYYPNTDKKSDETTRYWIASSSAANIVFYIGYNGDIGCNDGNTIATSIRPIVALNKGTGVLTED